MFEGDKGFLIGVCPVYDGLGHLFGEICEGCIYGGE